VTVATKDWLSDTTRSLVRDRIAAIEQRTGAELVVTVGLASGYYRHADMLCGAIASLGMLLFYLLYPEPLADDVSVATVVGAFPVGAFFCGAVAPLRRWLTSRRLLTENVRREARVRFVDQGITRTRARTGVLVYVSLFERTAEVVADFGIPIAEMDADWAHATRAVAVAVRSRPGVPAFLHALDGLGSLLERTVPRVSDDVNELADEVVS
jgi:putative membrane protein